MQDLCNLLYDNCFSYRESHTEIVDLAIITVLQCDKYSCAISKVPTIDAVITNCSEKQPPNINHVKFYFWVGVN